MKTRNALYVAAAAYLVCFAPVNATPIVGAPNSALATLTANLGNFDVALASKNGVGTFKLLTNQNGAVDQLNGGTIGGNTNAGTGHILNGFGVNSVHTAVAIKEHQAWVNAHGASAPNPVGADGLNGVGPCQQGQGGPADCSFTEGADWISFANTGMKVIDQTTNPSVAVVAVNSSTSPIARYSFSFTPTSLANLGLWVYADDTAEFFIKGADIIEGTNGFNDGLADGRQRIGPLKNTTQQTCAQGVIGCQPGEQAFIEMFSLSANTIYTIEIDMFQIGSGPVGILFAGGLMNVPEPATLALLGLGLLGIGAMRRRRNA